jgi:hypothetical protein
MHHHTVFDDAFHKPGDRCLQRHMLDGCAILVTLVNGHPGRQPPVPTRAVGTWRQENPRNGHAGLLVANEILEI